ncbi:MAG: hypothetical protein R3C28_30090 [Pirellulaceae bacterium]
MMNGMDIMKQMLQKYPWTKLPPFSAIAFLQLGHADTAEAIAKTNTIENSWRWTAGRQADMSNLTLWHNEISTNEV